MKGALETELYEQEETTVAAFEITAQTQEDDFSEDDEIREIFIEEAEEVLETLNSYLP